MEWIRLVIGAAFLFCGLAFFVMEIYGIFKYDYVINRMHAAAIGDTMGISLSLAGLMIFSGLNFTTLKIALIVVFLWFSSPVASHLLANSITLTPGTITVSVDGNRFTVHCLDKSLAVGLADSAFVKMLHEFESRISEPDLIEESDEQ